MANPNKSSESPDIKTEEAGYHIRAVSVASRRRQLNIYANSRTTQFLSGTTKQRLMLDQVLQSDKDRKASGK
ncbi:hypothetical protein Clacol_007151 [Clathrus columnatus]|uniref:Uncharacterized protein n=1 Tax=Clathrus columnatus TaxID=1419009 RepID=A0AAV5AJ71_9AGAM|nr:hypothetical protein Clacol_007151 [Clathrus columnatus]